MKKFNIISLISVIIVVGILTYIFVFLNNEDNLTTKSNLVNLPDSALDLLPAKSNNEGGLSIDVKLLSVTAEQPLRLAITFNTHQGDLDLDLTHQAILLDDQGSKYEPLEWQGENGGHHLSGTLIFPPLKKEGKQLKLIIKNIYGVDERVFEWDLE